jgi:hypothetical protein
LVWNNLEYGYFEDESVEAFSSKAKPTNKTGSKELSTLSELDMIKFMNNRM